MFEQPPSVSIAQVTSQTKPCASIGTQTEMEEAPEDLTPWGPGWRKMTKDDERVRGSNWANWSDIDMIWPAKGVIYMVISADIKFARTYMNYLGD